MTSNTTFNWDSPEVAALVRAALNEDIGRGDLTAQATVPADRRAEARILAKQHSIVAGLPLAERIFRQLDANIDFRAELTEGEEARAGATLVYISGNARAIVTAERTALNFLTHLCGVATLTRQFVDAIAGTRARIRDTRKTLPLLRALEKYAVRMGGGSNHRFGLYDAILIKENHIAACGSVSEAVRRARERADAAMPQMTAYESFQPPQKIEVQVEVRNEHELREALRAGAESVLLDNLSPEEARALVRIARSEGRCLIEVSGGVTLANVRAFAEAGPDYIAVGAITHSAPAADLSLLIETK